MRPAVPRPRSSNFIYWPFKLKRSRLTDRESKMAKKPLAKIQITKRERERARSLSLLLVVGPAILVNYITAADFPALLPSSAKLFLPLSHPGFGIPAYGLCVSNTPEEEASETIYFKGRDDYLPNLSPSSKEVSLREGKRFSDDSRIL